MVMSKVRNFIKSALATDSISVPIHFGISQKNVKEFRFYAVNISNEARSGVSCTLTRSTNYLGVFIPTIFIYVDRQIDLSDTERFFCNFDAWVDWGADDYHLPEYSFYGNRSVNLHDKYKIPDWVDIEYSRDTSQRNDPICVFKLFTYKNPRIMEHFSNYVSITELEKLFENSENLEQDVTNYLKKNLLVPGAERFNNLISHIFSCGILENIVELVQEFSDNSTGVLENLSLHELFKKCYDGYYN